MTTAFLVIISLSLGIIFLLWARFYTDTKIVKPINTSKITKSFNDSINTINNLAIKDSINKIIAAASIYHKANNVMLTSNWFSDLDDNIKLELKLYNDDHTEYKLIYTDYLNHNNTLLMTGKNNKFTILDDNNINTIKTHLEHIATDIKSQTINSFSFNIKPHALVFFKSRSLALASYPGYKHVFKSLPNDEFEGRFLLDNIHNIEQVINIFPDADLVKIYDNIENNYKSFNIDDISKIFLF